MDWLKHEFEALYYWFLVIGLFGIGLTFSSFVMRLIDKIFKKGDES